MKFVSGNTEKRPQSQWPRTPSSYRKQPKFDCQRNKTADSRLSLLAREFIRIECSPALLGRISGRSTA